MFNTKRTLETRAALVALFLVLLLSLVFLVGLSAPARAASPADEACRDWYEQQAPDEQAREDNEAQLGDDVDGDGCTGMLATPGSSGPVDGGLKDGGVGDSPGGTSSNNGASGEPTSSSEEPGGSSSDPSETGTSPKDCAERFAGDTPEEQVREREQDQQFGVDNDKDGCVGEQPADDATKANGTPVDTAAGSPVPEATGAADDGGLSGMVLGFFQGILSWLWDNTFGWALENMADAFKTNALSLPTLEGRGGLLSFYTGAVEKLRPAILVGILILGCLMMVRSDNYDLAYAGFQGLPKLMGVAIAMAFLPQFMGELSRITTGIAQAFFPSGGSLDSAGQELFKAAIGNMAFTNFLNLILLVAAAIVGMLVIVVSLLKTILYVVLYISGPFALTASLMPGLSSLAGSWFRGVVACAAIPTLWSIEVGIGAFAVRSPEAIFGPGTNALGFISEGAVTSIAAILILWLMYKTPFKVIEWAFNVQLPGRGGIVGLAKFGAALALAVPAKTAIAHATKGLLNRSTTGGGPVPKHKGNSTSGSGKPTRQVLPGKEGAGGKTAAARKIQQTRTQGQRERQGTNVSKNLSSYVRQRDRDQEHKEKFMQGRARKTGAPGMNERTRGRTKKKG
jgi:hypothetical protein